MYKLLLVSSDPAILDAYSQIKNWGQYGFREPRVAGSVEEAIETLQKHHADGIAFGMGETDNNRLGAFLAERYPLLPIVDACITREDIVRDLIELERFLTNINADTADERYDMAEQMQRIRHAYFRKMISGEVYEKDAVRRKLLILRSRMDPDSPCVLIRFALPVDANYLADRWHYGPDRLEIAMRNFFGAELEGMRMLVSVLENDQIYLLACPMRGHERTDIQAMAELVTAHAEQCMDHVREYMDIDMRIDSVTPLSSVLALTEH